MREVRTCWMCQIWRHGIRHSGDVKCVTAGDVGCVTSKDVACVTSEDIGFV